MPLVLVLAGVRSYAVTLFMGAVYGMAYYTVVKALALPIYFGEQGIVFADDLDVDTFDALFQVIEEIHQLEVERLKERLNRIAQPAAILGIRPLA